MSTMFTTASPGEKTCRICLDGEYEINNDHQYCYLDKLINPCRCKGTCKYIHVHCLIKLQSISLLSNNRINAVNCSICRSKYIYPSNIDIFYYKIIYLIYQLVNILYQSLINNINTCILIPMKTSIYALLFLFSLFLIIPSSIFKVIIFLRITSITSIRQYLSNIITNNLTYFLTTCEFPNENSRVIDFHSMDGPISNNKNNNSNTMENYNNTNHNNINIREGTLLIASNDLPSTSSFYHSIILIIQESRKNNVNDDITGIFINSSSTNPLLCLNLNCNESIGNNSDIKEIIDNNKIYTKNLLSRKLTTITYNKKIGIEEKHIHVKFNDNDHHDLFKNEAWNDISVIKKQAKIGGPDNEDVLTMIHNYGLCSEYSESIKIHHYKNHHRRQDYHHHNNIIINSSTNNRDSNSSSSSSGSSSSSIDLYVVNDQYIHDTLASIHTYRNNKTSNGHFYHNPAHKSININQQNDHHNDHHHSQHNQELLQIFQGNCIWQRTKLLDEINSGVWHVLSSDTIINQVDKECLHLSDIYNTIFMSSKWNYKSKDDVWQKYYDSIKKIG